MVGSNEKVKKGLEGDNLDIVLHDTSGGNAEKHGCTQIESAGLNHGSTSVDHIKRRVYRKPQRFIDPEAGDLCAEKVNDVHRVSGIEEVCASSKPQFRKKTTQNHNSNSEGKMVRIPQADDDSDVPPCAYFSGNLPAPEVQSSQSKQSQMLRSKKKSNPCPQTEGEGCKKQCIHRARTVLSWLLDMGCVSLNGVVQFRDPSSNVVVKDGSLKREGVLCNCCSMIFSIPQFTVHAGYNLQRAPTNIFLKNDKLYSKCLIEAWDIDSILRKHHKQIRGRRRADHNDDICAICGDDNGELLCCDNCPSAYHKSCLCLQKIPEGNWYCPNCICRTCGYVTDETMASNPSVVLQCSQCEHKYHEKCIEGRVPSKLKPESSKWFCGKRCKEVYMGLYFRVGVINFINDELSWTILRCKNLKKDNPKETIALRAECNSKIAVALKLMEECFASMKDPMTQIDIIPHVLYNGRSGYPRLNYKRFSTMVLEKNGVLIAAASLRVHGDNVAEMPFFATCSVHRRQGMGKRLMNEIEQLLITFKVKMLVVSAIPSVVETWISGFGYSHVDDEAKREIKNIILMTFPGSVLLKKNLLERHQC